MPQLCTSTSSTSSTDQKLEASGASEECKQCFSGVTGPEDTAKLTACVGEAPGGGGGGGPPPGMAADVPGECTDGDLAKVFPVIEASCNYQVECAKKVPTCTALAPPVLLQARPAWPRDY